MIPLLRVPPFPGARCRSLVRPGSTGNADFEAAEAAVAKARVGGTYWGAQPPLPNTPYNVVKIRDPEARAALIDRLGNERPVLSPDALAREHGECDPWHLLSEAAGVYADDGDELALVAHLAGVPVFCAQGQTLDSGTLDDRLRHSLLGAGEYVSPFSGREMSLSEAIGLSTHWRELVDANRPVSAAVGFAAWKRKSAAPLLWGGTGHAPFDVAPQEVRAGELVAAWKSRTPPATLAGLEQAGAEVIEVEDGFIRSIGLGADCVPPLSIVVDRAGIYFDPRRPSDLENILLHCDFPRELTDRAKRLRASIVAGGVSKYGAGTAREIRRNDRRHVLVVGQVEDDRSVQCGGGAVDSNVELLRRARRAEPEAFILYKPHPDVEAAHRKGAIDDATAMAFADEVVRNAPITALVEMVDEVHVNTSLAGFEALLRDTPVTTHGVPFYAGWGLTRDLGDVPDRRRAPRSLDELVAAVLLVYPRYLDPVSGLPCTAEVLVERLAGGYDPAPGLLVSLRRLQGFVKRQLVGSGGGVR
jgi:capsular polysaccharide export protein